MVKKKKCFHRTDGRSTQNYSSEPHKKIQKKQKLFTHRQTDGQPKTIVRNLTICKKSKKFIKALSILLKH